MRIAVLSDIHANLVALDAVLADAGTVDAIWHLGDVVGYGPDPNGVVRRLRDLGARGVRGNHDAAAVGGSEIDWFNPDARKAMEWTRRALEADARTWLADLPERRTEGGMELVHGSPRQPLWEYILSPGSARANLDRLDGAGGFHGHTHVPVLWRDAEGGVELIRAADQQRVVLDERRALINPGSVGQPRDGIPTASYLILDVPAPDSRPDPPAPERRPDAGASESRPDPAVDAHAAADSHPRSSGDSASGGLTVGGGLTAGGWPTVGAGATVTWHRAAYDIGAVQRAMRAAGLPAFLVRRLELGA